MKSVFQYLKNQFSYLPVMSRITKYDQKNNYQSYALGILWQYISPLSLMFFYYLMYSVLFHRTTVGANNLPYIPWLIMGMAVWTFTNSSTRGALRSILGNFGLANKISIPKSIFPTISMLSRMSEFLVLTGLALVVSTAKGYGPSKYWLGFIYCFIATVAFCMALGLFNAVVTVIYRDYSQLYISVMRIGMFISGAMIDLRDRNMPGPVRKGIMLNPFYYLTESWRDAMFSERWFWQNGTYTIFFWAMILLLFIFGVHLYNKYEESFGDYI